MHNQSPLTNQFCMSLWQSVMLRNMVIVKNHMVTSRQIAMVNLSALECLV